MTKGTFGESLKREREMRGVTLDEISAATRIATRFLRAIENEEWEQLPGGVFNRGFVRAVARYLGLDEENIVAEYTSTVDDHPSVPVWTGSPPAVTPQQPWLAWIIAAALVLALLIGSWLGIRRLIEWRAARRTAQTSALSSQPSSESTSSPEQAASDAPAHNAVKPAPPQQNGTSVEPALTPFSPSMEPFQLNIEASAQTHLTIVADRDVVFDKTIMPGETHSFWAADHFQVSTQDAGAVLLRLNGKKLAPFGSAGRAGKITLTRDALKGTSGGKN
jgi:cytoskeleton protein RodZ